MSEFLAPGAPDSRRVLTRVLAGIGAAAVALSLFGYWQSGGAPWVAIVGLVGTAAWAVEILRLRQDDALFWSLMVVRMLTSAISGPPTNVTGLIPGLVALLVIIGKPHRSPAISIAAPLGVLALSAVSVLVSPLLGAPVSTGSVIGLGVALVVTVLVAISRRQFRVGEEQSRQLLEQRLDSAQERARAATLAERSRIARDIHDVLAHSLGGLVLQLDATEALLEKGRTDDALARVRSSRALAAEGLDEARRAVAALRDPQPDLDLAAALEELVETHRELGGTAELAIAGEPATLSAERAAALRSAAREGLTNARRHAPGQPVRVSLEWSRDAVAVSASSPLPAVAVRTPGGGQGLAGVRERLHEVGGSASAGARDGDFVLEARVPTR